jgi:1,4-alpha-glucan branching enzyme
MPRLLAPIALLLGVACRDAKPADAPTTPPAMPAAADADWVARSALYEVFVRDFSPSGDFKGLAAGLGRIDSSGANVVWLMPVQPIGVMNRKGTLGSPYALKDYRAINPALGTATDLKELIAAAHQRGLKVILDWVPDHTAADHPWITEHPDYYHRNDKGEASTPRDPDGKLTDWTDVAQLDFGNPAVRREMTATMVWWLKEFDLDGFRVDVAGFVPYDYWKETLPVIRASVSRPILLLAEWGDPQVHNLGFDLSYSWDSYKRLKAVWKGARADSFVAKEVVDLTVMPPGAGRLRFTTNHDETAWDQPPVAIFGAGAGARAAYVASILLPGRPLLYNGQEVESPQKLPLFERQAVEWNQPAAVEARAHYARVIHLARTDSAFIGRELLPVTTSAPKDIIAYARGNRLVLVNARNRPASFTVSGYTASGAEDLLSGMKQAGDSVRLPAYGAVVLAPVAP